MKRSRFWRTSAGASAIGGFTCCCGCGARGMFVTRKRVYRRLHRGLQRTAQRRAAERDAVCRARAMARSLAPRLQRRAAAFELGLAHAAGLCGLSAVTEFATGQDPPALWGLRVPVPLRLPPKAASLTQGLWPRVDETRGARQYLNNCRV